MLDIQDRVGDQIRDHEDNLLKWIEEKILTQIFEEIQVRITDKISRLILKKEEEFLDEYSKKVLCVIKENCPFMFSCLNVWPFDSVANCSYCTIGYWKDYIEHQKDYIGKKIFSVVVTYDQFEQAGFNRDFVKRVTDSEVVLSRKLVKTKAMGGLSYSVPEIKQNLAFYIEKMNVSKEAYTPGQFCHHRDESLDFIFDNLSEEEFLKIVEEVKQEILNLELCE